MRYQAGFINRGVLLAIVLVVVSISIGVYAFIANSSPYRTIAEAKAPDAYGTIHVQAEVDRSSVVRNTAARELRFVIRDEKTHETMPVVYRGAIPESFDEAPRVVVVGSCKNGVFEADQILAKCPSRYSAEDKKPGTY